VYVYVHMYVYMCGAFRKSCTLSCTLSCMHTVSPFFSLSTTQVASATKELVPKADAMDPNTISHSMHSSYRETVGKRKLEGGGEGTQYRVMVTPRFFAPALITTSISACHNKHLLPETHF
jgi:hypothetical protein